MTNIRAGVDIDALTAEFDDLCNDILPSKITETMDKWADEHLSKFRLELGRFCSQFEAEYDVLVRAIHHVNYGTDKSAWPAYRLPQFVIAVENLKPLYSSYCMLAKGYYEDSMILTRVAYEAIMRIVYISLHPDDTCWGFADKHIKGARRFNLTSLIKDDLLLDWSEYRTLSSMVHCYAPSVLNKIAEIGKNGQKEPLTLGFDYSQIYSEVAINTIKFVLLIFMRMVACILFNPPKPDAFDTHLHAQVMRCIDLEQRCLISHPSAHWAAIVNDLDYLFRVVTAADEKKDWRAMRQTLKNG